MRLTRLSLLVLFLALILATPVATSSRELRARSTAFTTGPMVVVWGDPFGAMHKAKGQGSELLTVRGNVTARDDLPGYYVYDQTRVSGGLHAEWNSGGDYYVLDASFVLITDETPHMPTIIVPEADAFMVTGMDFAGVFSKNGEKTSAEGMAALIATPPGLFGYDVQSRTTTVILYRSLLGAQFVICWSEQSQQIFGMDSPATDRMRQKVLTS